MLDSFFLCGCVQGLVGIFLGKHVRNEEKIRNFNRQNE